jgi:hypothetical protein
MLDRDNQPPHVRIIVDPGLTFITPDNSRAVSSPKDGRAAKSKPFLQQAYVPTGGISDPSDYLRDLKPEEYEIAPAQATIARALTSVSAEGSGQSRVWRYKYGTSKDLVEELAGRNEGVSRATLTGLVDTTITRVVGSYRIAMAMRENIGGLPEGSPNISGFIDYLEDLTIEVDDHNIRPYLSVSAARLNSVFTRETSAELLMAIYHKGEPSKRYFNDLGRYLAYQQQSP